MPIAQRLSDGERRTSPRAATYYPLCLRHKNYSFKRASQIYRCDDTFFFSMDFSHPQTKQNAGIIVVINVYY